MGKRSEFSKMMKNLSFTDSGEVVGGNPLKNKPEKPRKPKKTKIVFSNVITPSTVTPTKKGLNVLDSSHNGKKKIQPFKPVGEHIPVRIDSKTIVYAKSVEDIPAIKARYTKLIDIEKYKYKEVKPKTDNSYAKKTAKTYEK